VLAAKISSYISPNFHRREKHFLMTIHAHCRKNFSYAIIDTMQQKTIFPKEKPHALSPMAWRAMRKNACRDARRIGMRVHDRAACRRQHYTTSLSRRARKPVVRPPWNGYIHSNEKGVFLCILSFVAQQKKV